MRMLRSRRTIALVVAAVGVVAAAGALAQSKSTLIGKLEGPEVVTDSSKFPKTFREAPQLAEQVKAGKLPPVAERIGQDPLVIKPLHDIGKYGGTWRGGFTGPADFWNGYRCCSGPDHLLFWDYTGDKVTPNIAKGYEMQDGGRTLVLHLRRGMKWSDGKPFTADDFVFWFEDIYRNKDLVPTPSAAMAINGKQGVLEKVDTYTVKFKFPEPYYMLPDVLAGSTDLAGQAWRGAYGLGSYAPAHYLKQFHPKYVAQAELDKKAKDAKFDSWVRMFFNRSDWSLNPDLPVLTPWKTVTPSNTPTWTLERNPYSVFVDTAGNQLPYIDRVVLTLAENLEVINLRAIAGEYDFQARHLDLAKVPVFIENQQRGGYKLYLDPGDYGGDMIIKFNLSYEADPEIAKWMNTTDFRRALALGIDRDQINETFWLGTGTPSSVVPADGNKYNPGPEYRKMWATLDLKKANEMLDKVGLAKKDAEGYRLRTDGKGRLRLELVTVGGQFVPYTPVGEMIKQQWRKIGIDLDVKELERNLAFTRDNGNENQMITWANDGSEMIYLFPRHALPVDAAEAHMGMAYAKWYASRGAAGKKPDDPEMLRAFDLFREAFGASEENRVKNAKEIWKIAVEQMWSIGTVGQSPAVMGVRIVKNNMGNVPDRQVNAQHARTPHSSMPITFYFK